MVGLSRKTICPSLPGFIFIYALFMPSCGSPLSSGFVDIVTPRIKSVGSYLFTIHYYSPTHYSAGIVLNELYSLSNVNICIVQLGTNFNPKG